MKIKQIVLSWLPKSTQKFIRFLSIIINDYGLLASMRNNQSRIGLKACPWFTFPAIEFLLHLDFSDKNILEFGSGNSTLYWSGRAKNIVSVEHDNKWHNKIQQSLKLDNVKLILTRHDSNYENVIDHYFGLSNVVVIDGIRRAEVVKLLIDTYKQNQMNILDLVILDNSDRYPKLCCDLALNLNMIQIDFHGFGPINSYSWTTSFFLNRSVSLEYLAVNRDLKSLGTIE
jgi:hypothetical protein